eukprot:sb/3460939/
MTTRFTIADETVKEGVIVHGKFMSISLQYPLLAGSETKKVRRIYPALSQGSSRQPFGYTLTILKPHKRRPTFTSDRSEILGKYKHPETKYKSYFNLKSEVTQELYAVRKVKYRYEELRSLKYRQDQVDANDLSIREGYTNFGLYVEETFNDVEERPRPLATVERIEIEMIAISAPTVRPILECEGQWFHRTTKYKFGGHKFIQTEVLLNPGGGGKPAAWIEWGAVKVGVLGSHEIQYIGEEKATTSVIIQPSTADTKDTPKEIISVAKNKRVFVVRQHTSFRTFYFDLNTDKRPREHVIKGVFSEQSNHLDYHLLQCRVYKDRIRLRSSGGRKQKLNRIEGLYTRQKRAWKIRCSKVELAKREVLSFGVLKEPDQRMELIISSENGFNPRSETVSQLIINNPHWIVYTTTRHDHVIDRNQDISKVKFVVGGSYRRDHGQKTSASYVYGSTEERKSAESYTLSGPFKVHFESKGNLHSVHYRNLQKTTVEYRLATEKEQKSIEGSGQSYTIDTEAKSGESYSLDLGESSGKESESYSLQTDSISGESQGHSVKGGESYSLKLETENQYKDQYTLQTEDQEKKVIKGESYTLQLDKEDVTKEEYSVDYKTVGKGEHKSLSKRESLFTGNSCLSPFNTHYSQGSSRQPFGYTLTILKPHKRRPTFTSDRSEILGKYKHPETKYKSYFNLKSEVTQELYAVRKVKYRYEELRSLKYRQDQVDANDLSIREGYTNFGLYVEETFNDVEERPRPLATVERIEIEMIAISAPTVRPILEFEGQWFHRTTKYKFGGHKFIQTEVLLNPGGGGKPAAWIESGAVKVGVLGSHEIQYIGEEKATTSVIIQPSTADTKDTPKEIISVAKNKRVFVFPQKSLVSNHLDYHLLQCRVYKDRVRLRSAGGRKQKLNRIEGLNTRQKRAWKIRCSKAELAKREVLSFGVLTEPDQRMELIISSENGLNPRSETVSQLIINNPHWIVYTTTRHDHVIDRNQDISKVKFVLGRSFRTDHEQKTSASYVYGSTEERKNAESYTLSGPFKVHFESKGNLHSVHYRNLQKTTVEYRLATVKEQKSIEGESYTLDTGTKSAGESYSLDLGETGGKESESYTLQTDSISGQSQGHSVKGGESYSLQLETENQYKDQNTLHGTEGQEKKVIKGESYTLQIDKADETKEEYSVDYKTVGKGEHKSTESYSLQYDQGDQKVEQYSLEYKTDQFAKKTEKKDESYSLQLDQAEKSTANSSKKGTKKSEESYSLQWDENNKETEEYTFQYDSPKQHEKKVVKKESSSGVKKEEKKGVTKQESYSLKLDEANEESGEYSVQGPEETDEKKTEKTKTESYDLQLDEYTEEKEDYSLGSGSVHFNKSNTTITKHARAVGGGERRIVEKGSHTRRGLSRREVSRRAVEEHHHELRGTEGIQRTGARVTGRNMMHIRYRKLGS